METYDERKQKVMTVELISYTHNPIKTCAIAASMCYDSKPTLGIVKGCIESGHTSVLEHANFTFKISGASRSFLAQMTRHRIASYSVQSQRYLSMGNMNYYSMPNGNGEKRNGHCKYDINQEQFLCEQYNRGISAKELSDMYNIPETTINEILKRNNCKKRSISESKLINHDYFNTIDTHDKAYILGFIYSDGCVGTKEDGTKNLIIDQLDNESILLRYIVKQLKPTGRIVKAGHDDMARLCVQSNAICDSLEKYGITPRKAHAINPSLVFENIPKEYIKDFIRGVFEGDGSIYINPNKDSDVKFSITGTYETCKQIQDYLMSELGLNETKIYALS